MAPPQRNDTGKAYAVLFKDPPENDGAQDAYAAELAAQASLSTVYVPVLDTRTHTGELEAILQEQERAGTAFSAIAVTSARAMACLCGRTDLPATITIFSVGSKTTAALGQHKDKLDIRESTEGNAESLAEMIVAWWRQILRRDALPPVLFLCGDKRLDTLPQALQQANVPLREVCVYTTVPRDDLPIQQHTSQAAWWAFFSPSGVRTVSGAVQRGAHTRLPRLAAIGATTAAEVCRCFSVSENQVAIAKAPNAHALAQAVSIAPL